MVEKKEDKDWIFWTTIVVSFVLIEHNSADSLFILALAAIPFLAFLFYYKKSFYPLILYILAIGILGRITQYYHSGYGSDVLLAVRDFVGYFVHGQNVYREVTMTVDGAIPFSYLPFNIFWYLPAYFLQMDFRFFEMLVSIFVPVCVFFYGMLTNKRKILPFLAVVSLTPFLIDLSADGSNDNSAIFILLASLVSFAYSYKNKSKRFAVISAILLGLAMSFKHYIFFYIPFFIQFLFLHKHFLQISYKKYLFYAFVIAGIIMIPFIVASPDGFLRSFMHIEGGIEHPVWGWNIWRALSDLFMITLPNDVMRFVRLLITAIVAIILFCFFSPKRLNQVFINTGLTMLTFFILSKWTTPAYFTFLIPLLGLSAFNIEDK